MWPNAWSNLTAVNIICLSAEAADICARLGAWDQVIAVSAYASQKGLAPRPVISGFSSANTDGIATLHPDLVITFSDVQADIAAGFIRAGCNVLATNQRTLAGIADAIRLIGGAIGRAASANALAWNFLEELESLRIDVLPRPRVYFEEWPDPMISGIGWVGELIEHCGGVDVFAARRGPASRDRTVTPAEVVAANPDILLASWCGKPVDIAAIRARPGFAEIQALKVGQIHALDSGLFLQPGPRVLEGGRELRRIFEAWRACIHGSPRSA